jgi:ankyrin repeat protein
MTLTSKTAARFLLVTLNTNYIRSANTGYEITNLIEEIQNMTPGPYEDRHSFRQRVLDAAFSRYLDRVVKVGDELQGTWSWAPLILRSVRDARRPFTIAELQHALGSWEMKEKYREVYNPDLELVEICMGLINVDKDQRVQFFHTKLREYLGNHWLKKLPWCHEDLAISCLVYLSQDEFATGWCKDSQALAKRQASHPFAEYASKHWAKHLSEVDLPTMSTLQPLALKFLRSRGKVQSSWQMVRLEGPSTSSTPSDSGLRVLIIIERMKGEIADYAPCGLSGLHLICHFKLHALIPPLVESLGPNSLEERDSMERRPIFFAATATYDNGDAVLEWPDTTSDGLDVRDASSDSPLRRAAASVKCLLDAGAEPDLRDARNFSPLHQAAESGNVAVLRMLTGHQKPIDINSMTVDPSQMRIQIIKPSGRSIFSAPGRTALQLASRYGHLEFVKLLCTFGDLDAGILDGKGETAWHRAAKYDHVGVIRCLAEVKGVNLRKRSYDGRTALHLAAKYHRVNAVRCLTKLDPLLWYFEDHNCLTVDETIALGDDPTSTPMQMLETLICKPTGGSRGRTPEEVVALVNSILRRLQKRFDWSNKHQQLLEARSPAIQRPRSLGPARSIPRKTFRVQSQPPHHVHLPHHNALRRRKSTPMITERPWIGTTYTDRTRATSQPATRHETTDASRQDRFVRLFDAKNGAAVRGRLDRYLNFMPDDV